MKIEIYDATLREGSQTAGVVFSEYEKLKVIADLRALGIACIEAGYYAANTCAALEELAAKAGAGEGDEAPLSVLVRTRRPGIRACDDPVLVSLAGGRYSRVAVVGKALLSQVTEVLGTDAAENLAMIRDTVGYLKAAGKSVIFDAEHFFDGLAEDPDYALATVRAAAEAGAETAVLCDTNGGMLPEALAGAVAQTAKAFPGLRIGIHTHNDIGMADACAVAAVGAGAEHVQCTVAGIGERCGNADLFTVIPVLQVKLEHDCIPAGRVAMLTRTARHICQTANLGFDESEPFVGGHAFLHKAGLHIDAVRKNPSSFEHMDPAVTGNRRSIVVSELSGRAAVADLLEKNGYEIGKDSPETRKIMEALMKAEAGGCQYDNSEASLRLLAGYALGLYEKPFRILDYKLSFSAEAAPERRWTAIVKAEAGGEEQLRVGEGDGPVNALDIAAHLALKHRFPCIAPVKMIDIKARIDSNDAAASASIVRVYVEYGDGTDVWRTMGASTDIIAASWQALVDAYEYCILLREGRVRD